MIQPVIKEHELICPGCGCVLGEIDQSPETNQQQKTSVPPSLNMFLLGSALETNIKYRFHRTREQFYQERVLRKLVDITRQYAIPDRFAYATFNQLKRKRSGFRSESQPIKELILILSKDENYIYFPKMRAIKARYENADRV